MNNILITKLNKLILKKRHAELFSASYHLSTLDRYRNKFGMIIKLLVLFIGLFFCNYAQCFAAEQLEIQFGKDYLITTDESIKTTIVENNSIVTLTPFFTIFNEKNVLLLHPVAIGATKFTIFLDKSDTIFNVEVKSAKKDSDFKTIQKGSFEIMLLDAPPDLNDVEFSPKGAK